MKKTYELLHTITRYLNSTILFSMFFIILLQVIFRKVFHSPLTWPEEIALLTMVWVTFIGAYQCTFEESHLKLSFLESKFTLRKKSILLIVSKTIVIVFLGIANYWALPFIQKAGQTELPITGLPMYVPYGIIWISLILMLLETVFQIILEVNKIRSFNPVKEGENS